MTVRISKPPIDLRSKLSELERPIGIKGNELMRAETAQDARDLVGAGRKNMVINGNMRMFQRGNSGNVPNTGTYFLDRFQARNNTAGTLYMTQQSGAAGPPGFRSWLLAQCDGADTSVGANDYARIQQYIEGYNCFMDWGYGNTDYVTASFWVKSNKTGVYCFQIEDGDALPLYCQEYTIEESDVWQKIVLTIPPPPTGTWRGADNGIGARLTWTLMAGSGHPTTANVWQTGYGMRTNNQVNFMDNANNNFYLTGVQLEVGKNATEFEYLSMAEQLTLCERYYQKWTGVDNSYHWWVAHGYGVHVYANIPLTTTLGPPTRTIEYSTNTATDLFSMYGNSSTSAHIGPLLTSTPAIATTTRYGPSFYVTLSASTYTPYGTAVLWAIKPNQWIAIDAEL